MAALPLSPSKLFAFIIAVLCTFSLSHGASKASCLKDMKDAMKGMLKVAGQSVTAINVTEALPGIVDWCAGIKDGLTIIVPSSSVYSGAYDLKKGDLAKVKFILMTMIIPGKMTYEEIAKIPKDKRITTASGQDIVCLGNRVFKGLKQPSSSEVYKQIFASSRINVFVATNFFIPASFRRI